MKAFKILILCSLAFIACDKVNDPIVKKNVAVGSKFITNSNKAYSNYKKILLEDYTGHRCPNCPAANDVIKKTLIPRYRDTLVVIAVHQGNTFASPLGIYVNDYRTTAGEEWGDSFDVGFYPAGLINRRVYKNYLIQAYSTWVSAIPVAKAAPFWLKLDVTTNYDPTARALNLDVNAKFNTAYPNNVKIVALYLQDSIVGPQDVKGVETEYEFEHMLRGDINGTWGTDLKTTPIAANDSVSVSFNNISIPASIKNVPVNDKKVSVVVFAYDAVTKEVLQAEKLDISTALSRSGNPSSSRP